MRGRRWVRIGIVGVGGLLLAAVAVYLAARPTVIEGGSAPLTWAECHPEQVRVMVHGTFHLEPWADRVDVLEPRRREELAGILEGLADFAPDRIALEHPYRNAARMDSLYRRHLAGPAAGARAGAPGGSGALPVEGPRGGPRRLAAEARWRVLRTRHVGQAAGPSVSSSSPRISRRIP